MIVQFNNVGKETTVSRSGSLWPQESCLHVMGHEIERKIPIINAYVIEYVQISPTSLARYLYYMGYYRRAARRKSLLKFVNIRQKAVSK